MPFLDQLSKRGALVCNHESQLACGKNSGLQYLKKFATQLDKYFPSTFCPSDKMRNKIV